MCIFPPDSQLLSRKYADLRNQLQNWYEPQKNGRTGITLNHFIWNPWMQFAIDLIDKYVEHLTNTTTDDSSFIKGVYINMYLSKMCVYQRVCPVNSSLVLLMVDMTKVLAIYQIVYHSVRVL